MKQQHLRDIQVQTAVKELPYWIGSLTLEYGVVGSIPGQAVSGSFVQYPLLSVRPRL